MPKLKKTKKQDLRQAPPECCFWVNEGPILKDLKDLHGALKGMDEEKFSYHANKEKNDFAVWVEEVLQDRSCAQKLRRAPSRGAAAAVVGSCLK